jgi:hypothetical protein
VALFVPGAVSGGGQSSFQLEKKGTASPAALKRK